MMRGFMKSAMMRFAMVCGALLFTALPANAQLTLEQVVERAAKDSHGAQAAFSALEAARLRHSSFHARERPQISVGGMAPNYYKSISPVIQPDGSTSYLPRGEMETSLNVTMSQVIPSLGSRVFVSSLLNRIEPLSGGGNPYYQSSPLLIGIEQDIFRPRTQLWDGKEANLRAGAAERVYLETREDNAARAAGAYFDLYAAQINAANAVSNAAVNDSLFQISQGRYQVGKIAENDLLQSELAVLKARTAVAETSLAQERALAKLRIELNMPEDATLSIAPPSSALAIDVNPDSAVQYAIANRSVMQELDLQRVQAQRRITTARLQNSFSARITAGFGYNQTAPLFNEAYRSPLQQQRFGMQVDMPLVRWGAGKDEVGAARADEKRIVALAERARRELAQEAYFAAKGYSLARLQLNVAAKADTVATRRFEVAKDRYVIGKIGIGELYIAQTEKDQALRSYVEAVRAYWLSYYQLRRVTLHDFQLGRRID